jgi:hypothetical protein
MPKRGLGIRRSDVLVPVFHECDEEQLFEFFGESQRDRFRASKSI